MSFETLIMAVASRMLPERTCRLVIEPAVADLLFEHETRRLGRALGRVALIRTLAAAMAEAVARHAADVLPLTIVPAGYYIFMVALCFDFADTRHSFAAVAAMITALSLVMIVVSFWPERRARLSE